MGRQAREFTAAEVAAMVDLFNAGVVTYDIGQLQVPPCAAVLVTRALRPILGDDLRVARNAVQRRMTKKRLAASEAGLKLAAKAKAKAAEEKKRLAEAGEEIPPDLFERYQAGYAMALTHVAIHGLDAAHEHCYGALVDWVEQQENYEDCVPPPFWRTTQ